MKPLDLSVSRSVVESFIKKTVQSESSSLAGGAFLTDRHPDLGIFRTNHHIRLILLAVNSNDIPGLLLFDIQIKDIVSHRLASNPLFLRLLLRSVAYLFANLIVSHLDAFTGRYLAAFHCGVSLRNGWWLTQ